MDISEQGSNSLCDATKQLPEHFEKHSKHLHSTQKFNHVAIENEKVVGYFLTKTCLCHHQIKQNQEKVERCFCPNRRHREKHFPTVGQFYKVRYSFLHGNGGEVVQVLPAMCSKNNLRNISSHSWSLSGKTIIYLMIPIKHGSLKEISMKFFLSQILPVEGSTNRKIKYESFMIYVRLIFILNLIC